MSRWPLDQLEIAEGSELQTQVLKSCARLVDDQNIK